jgi:predicted adenylyl cyclase CyaB
MSAPLRHNLEIKARHADLAGARDRLLQFGAKFAGLEAQTDTYFRVPHGRLKLREIDGQSAVLIWYERPDRASARSSHYHLVPVADAAGLRSALSAALGVRGTVCKRREIYLYQNVRIHLDAVAGLGSFVEFEAVLGADRDLNAAQAMLDQLSAALGIDRKDYLAPSYADLLGLA